MQKIVTINVLHLSHIRRRLRAPASLLLVRTHCERAAVPLILIPAYLEELRQSN